MLRGVFTLIFSAILTSCSQDGGGSRAQDTAPDAKACGFSQNVRKQRVSWKGTAALYLDSSCPIEFKPYVQKAIATWNSALGRHGEREIFSYAGEVSGAKGAKNDDGRNVISCMELTSTDAKFKQAVTSLRWEGRSITNADIILDTHRFYFFDVAENRKLVTRTEGQGGPVDLLSVLTHEMGHAAGLEHSDDEESVMFPTLRYGQLRREIANNDVKNAKCEY